MTQDPSGTPAPPITATSDTQSRRQIQSDRLMQGCEQLEIVHRGEIYRLRITRQGKLILTK